MPQRTVAQVCNTVELELLVGPARRHDVDEQRETVVKRLHERPIAVENLQLQGALASIFVVVAQRPAVQMQRSIGKRQQLADDARRKKKNVRERTKKQTAKASQIPAHNTARVATKFVLELRLSFGSLAAHHEANEQRKQQRKQRQQSRKNRHFFK